MIKKVEKSMIVPDYKTEMSKLSGNMKPAAEELDLDLWAQSYTIAFVSVTPEQYGVAESYRARRQKYTPLKFV